MFARRLSAVLAAMTIALVSGSRADELDDKLAQIATRLEAANALFASDDGMNMQELSKMAIELESIMNEMREVERAFGVKRDTIEATFRDESESLSGILGYMATLQSAPAPDFLLHPDGALGAIHANILVETVLPQFETKLKDIATQVQFWRSINEKQVRLSSSSEAATEEINKVRTQLVAMSRNDAPKRVVQEPAVLDALFAVSDNLTDFVRGMEDMPVGGDPAPSFSVSDTKGTWAWPASGNRLSAPVGLTIWTKQSVITTPIPGTVRFAENFLDYGNMIILEPQKGYLVVFAGFHDLVAKEGDILKSGDVLGFFATKNEETSQNALENQDHHLYIEVRKNGVNVAVDDYFE